MKHCSWSDRIWWSTVHEDPEQLPFALRKCIDNLDPFSCHKKVQILSTSLSCLVTTYLEPLQFSLRISCDLALHGVFYFARRDLPYWPFVRWTALLQMSCHTLSPSGRLYCYFVLHLIHGFIDMIWWLVNTFALYCEIRVTTRWTNSIHDIHRIVRAAETRIDQSCFQFRSRIVMEIPYMDSVGTDLRSPDLLEFRVLSSNSLNMDDVSFTSWIFFLVVRNVFVITIIQVWSTLDSYLSYTTESLLHLMISFRDTRTFRYHFSSQSIPRHVSTIMHHLHTTDTLTFSEICQMSDFFDRA